MFLFKKSFCTDDIPDLSGKIALVTGGNIGLGFETVKELARKNAKVYIVSRNEEKARSAIKSIQTDIPTARLEFLQLDLSDLKNTKRAAEEFVRRENKLNILVNNAGIMATPFELSKDGIEMQFHTNHLGHFLLTTLLLPLIEQSIPSRIVIVSSFGHTQPPPEGINFDSLNDPKALHGWSRYAVSKLANILFAKSLAERLKNKEVYVNCLHPGMVNTNLKEGPRKTADAYQSWITRLISIGLNLGMSTIAMNPAQGALTQLYLATSSEVEDMDYRGEYFTPIAVHSSSSKLSCDKSLRDRLWEFSEKLLKEKLAD
ncbi:hypothetical protein HK098_007419 [Nowakowskiella sp. JEL0407]|nr:hypothetical protein HK098_007419 [Nowakowskiella sp. JEL0407]